MGMSTHIVGIKPPDETWIKMKNVYDACKAAGLSIPMEVENYFEDEKPDPRGVVIWLDNIRNPAVTTWDDGSSAQGVEVDLTKLPKDIKILRFFNSW
jgi:hypothetical protein